MLCFLKGGGCRQEVWRLTETVWSRVGEEIPRTSQESGQGEAVGENWDLTWMKYYYFYFSWTYFTHFTSPLMWLFSVLSLVPLYSDLNEMVFFNPLPSTHSNPCNCLYQQKKNVNKPVLKKPVKSKFAAFKASLKSSAAPAQTIEHDWGLFKVTSPLRKPSYHCEGKRDIKDMSFWIKCLEQKKNQCTSIGSQAPP